MDAPTSRQQLLQALPALFPGDDNVGFCGDAAAVIYQMPEDGAAGLLALPEPYRKAAITAAVRAAAAATAAAGAAGSAAAAAAATGGPYRIRELLQARAPSIWTHQCSGSSSSSTQRPYPACVVNKWDLTLDAKQEILQYLTSKCKEATLPDDPCASWSPDCKLRTEADCNAMFWSCFGRPVAVMYTAVAGKSTEFTLGLLDNPSKGVPDFWFRDSAGMVLLLGEGKRPTVLSSNRSVTTAISQNSTALSCVQQICDYMRARDMRYGFLTYLNGTFFIRRVGEHEYAFTDAVGPCDTGPTVLEMLMYVLIKQQAEGPWQRALRAPEAVPAGGPTGALAAGAPSASGPAYRLRSSAAAGGGAGGGREACSYEPQQQHALSALTVTGERLGTGKCGGVLIGRLYGQLAAIKAMDLSKQGHLLPKLQAEVAIYDRLRPLQGVCIPVLYGCGFWDEGRTYFVATSIVAGQHPDRGTRGAGQAAEQALREIHALGVLHGDIRADNVLVAAEDGSWQAWLIDFDLSTESCDLAAQAAELAELRALFRPSDTDASTASEMAWD